MLARVLLCGVTACRYRRKILRMQRRKRSGLKFISFHCNLLLLWVTLDFVIKCCSWGEQYLSHAHAVSTYIVENQSCSQRLMYEHLCSAYNFSHEHFFSCHTVNLLSCGNLVVADSSGSTFSLHVVCEDSLIDEGNCVQDHQHLTLQSSSHSTSRCFAPAIVGGTLSQTVDANLGLMVWDISPALGAISVVSADAADIGHDQCKLLCAASSSSSLSHTYISGCVYSPRGVGDPLSSPRDSPTPNPPGRLTQVPGGGGGSPSHPGHLDILDSVARTGHDFGPRGAGDPLSYSRDSPAPNPPGCPLQVPGGGVVVRATPLLSIVWTLAHLASTISFLASPSRGLPAPIRLQPSKTPAAIGRETRISFHSTFLFRRIRKKSCFSRVNRPLQEISSSKFKITIANTIFGRTAP